MKKHPTSAKARWSCSGSTHGWRACGKTQNSRFLDDQKCLGNCKDRSYRIL